MTDTVHPPPTDPARPPYALWRQDRDRNNRRRIYHAVGRVEAEPVDRPITVDEVWKVASQGFPLWESLPEMQLRNRRITVAYADLSERLANLLARNSGELGERDANWCTFSSWSSKTIGTWIERDAVPDGISAIRRIPGQIHHGLVTAAHWLFHREDGAVYRCLAAGNRFVFLEIGLTVALFIETFENVDRTRADDSLWDTYWACMQQALAEFSQLDPSWMLTEAPEPVDLKLGMRQYFEALFIEDPKIRAEHILAGNILIAAYEQRRVDGYIAAALALFTKRAIRALVRGDADQVKERARRWFTTPYARLMTHGIVLKTHTEQLRVARPLVPPPGDDAPLYPPELDPVATPLLQALLTRYDESDGMPYRRRARNWASYEQRMNYITHLFRSRQRDPALFTPVFEPEAERTLLAGQLPVSATEPLPDGG